MNDEKMFSLGIVRCLDVLHRQDTFITRVYIHTDGDNVYFDAAYLDKDGKVVLTQIDNEPLTIKEFLGRVEDIRAESHPVSPST
jgi:hypothetical protein